MNALRPTLICSARVVCLAFACTVSLTSSAAEERPPNILLIITDQQHAEMMSCAGNKFLNTPAIDSLARDGIRFANAYVTNPVCVPSRISMATGVMAGRLGVLNNGDKARVPPEVDNNSLGKLVKRAGYKTFYGKTVKGKQSVDHLYKLVSDMPPEQLPPLPDNFRIPELEPEAIELYSRANTVTPSGTMRKVYDERQWQIYRWIYCRLKQWITSTGLSNSPSNQRFPPPATAVSSTRPGSSISAAVSTTTAASIGPTWQTGVSE